MFLCDFVCHAIRFVPWVDRQRELVVVDSEDLLSLEVQNNFFEVFRRGVYIFPTGIVLPIFQERQIHSTKVFVYLAEALVVASVTADIDLTSAGFDQK